MKRKKTVRRPGRKVTPAPKALLDEPPALPAPSPEPAGEHEPVTSLATPELAFAARVPSPMPSPALPANQRAIFFDVENASQPGRIAQVIQLLAIDRVGFLTEFVAVGNWRVIGHETARMLARHGAQLVHSAPSTGVRDWSDLRIAVSAGAWLAAARPGDVLEIVSDDRAFDAVGDVAAGLGIAFRRLSSRSLTGTPDEAPRPAVEPQAVSRRSRGRHGRRSPRAGRAPVVAAAEPRRAEPRDHDPLLPAGAHTAPHDEIIDIVRELAQRSSNGAVLIDTIERTLKARGFARPPGSPRLVTRLRRIKELSVSPTGMITVVGEPVGNNPAAAGVAAEPPVGEPAAGRRRRRSRRGGRGRRRAAPGGQALTS